MKFSAKMRAGFALLCVIPFVSCIDYSNLAIPEAVEVSTKATYKVGFGDVANLMDSLTENFDMKGMMDNMKSSLGENVQMYDYDAGDDVLAYLVHYPLYELPFDPSTYLSGMDLDSALSGMGGNGMNVSQSITIPDGELNMDPITVSPSYPGSGTFQVPSDFTFTTTLTTDKNIDFTSLKDCKVKKFSFSDAVITISVPLPSGWTGASATLSGFSMGEGTTEDSNATEPAGNWIFYKEYNWVVTDLAPDTAQLSPTGSLNFTIPEGETINTENPVVVTISVKINKLSSVTLDTSSFGFTMDKDNNATELPDTMLQYVENITFGELSGSNYYKHTATNTLESTPTAKGLGLKATVTNTLGASLPISLVSKAFNLNITNGTIPACDTPTEKIWGTYDTLDLTYSGLNTRGVLHNDTVTSEDGAAVTTYEKYYVDLAVHIGSETSAGSGEYEATLTNVPMGQTCTIALEEVGFEFDWDTVTMNTSSFAQTGEMDMSSFDFSSMLSSTGMLSEENLKNIEISSLPMYFYLSKDQSTTGGLSDILNDLSMKGTIKLAYSVPDETDSTKTVDKTKYLVGTEEEEIGTIAIKSTVPWPEDTSEVITPSSQICTYLTEKNASFYTDFAEIVNAEASGMKFEYSITPSSGSNASSITVYSYMTEDTSSSESTISIDMAAILSLKLTVKNAITLDLSSIMNSSSSSDSSSSEGTSSGSESSSSESSSSSSSTDSDTVSGDLLNRSSASDYATYATYAEAIQEVGVYYSIKNFVLNAPGGLTFTMDDTHSGKTNASEYSGVSISQKLETGSDTSKFAVEGEDIVSIMTNYFNPDISFGIGKGELSLSRSAINGETTMELPVSFVIKMSGKPITVWQKSE